MKANSLNRLPSWHQRLTACFAAALVLALVVLASSPQLHGWLHSLDSVSANGHRGTHGTDHRLPGHDDDGCVVATFANGVIIASFGLIAIATLWHFINFVPLVEAAASRPTPRYWLPPLCGPPLS